MGVRTLILVAFGLLLATLAPSSAQQAGPRHALVIGNAAYRTAGWELVNPVNDATLIAQRLRGLGFQVTTLTDATTPQMDQAVVAFAQRLKAGGEDAVGVFYYAGHAAESGGENLLVPVNIGARTMDDLRYQGLSLNYRVLRLLAGVGNRVNVVVLDACRDVPLPSLTRSGPAGGLVMDDVPTNILLAYATRAGQTAPDNPGETNSVFTRTLADALASNAADPLETLFTKVQQRVFAATGAVQRPEFRNQLLRAPEGFALAASSRPGETDVQRQLREARERIAALERERQSPVPPASAGTSSPTSAPAPNRPMPAEAGGTGSRPAGTTIKDCAECPDMVVIPAGAFVMGSPSSEERYSGYDGREEPQRTVSIRSFAVSKFEITFAQWDACVAGGGCGGYRPADQGWGRRNQPVINVSWSDVQSYVTWINGRVGGQRYRLLSEAEWEYAARAGSRTAFSWGNTITPDQARYWYSSSYGGSPTRANPDRTAPVGSYAANAFGLYDMHGNVWEWVQDCYVANYNNAPSDGSARETNACSIRVIRGGSWNDNPTWLRSASRIGFSPTNRYYYLGFRLARTL